MGTDYKAMEHYRHTLTASLVRATAVSVALLMVTILTIGESQAAFTATTDSTSSFTTHSVTLTDDDSGSALFNITGMTAGDSVVDCITVTYAGTALPAPVRLHATTTGTLDTYLDTTIEIGDGGSFGDCTGFTPDSTLFNNTLANLSTTHTNWATGLATHTAAVNPTAKTFRITVTVQNDNNAQGLTTNATITFETQA